MFSRFVVLCACLGPAHALGDALCRSPKECGDALGLCSSSSEFQPPLARADLATVCLCFHGADDKEGRSGSKALFQVEVDHYATLTVDSLRGLMGGPWSQKEKYSHVWVGTQGKRTIGQRRGAKDGLGNCNATTTVAEAAQVDADGSVCYGWALHDKPVVLPNNQLSMALTVLIHLDMGQVNRIQWDSGCNLVRTTMRARADGCQRHATLMLASPPCLPPSHFSFSFIC